MSCQILEQMGCIQSWGRVLGRLPKLVKSLAQDSRAQNNHTVEGRRRPAHPWTGQALFELLNATFPTARTNRLTRRTQLGGLHSAGGLGELIGEVLEGGAVEVLKDKVKFGIYEQG